MKMHIIRENGRWTVNGKRIQDLDLEEQHFMNGFFQWAKFTNQTSKTISNEND